MTGPGLTTLLTRHRPRLVRYFARKGRVISRHEAPEDLAQGVHLHAIANQGRFSYRGDKQFVAWMLKVARQHLARRIQHWTTLKRDAGPMMRITLAGTRGHASPGTVLDPQDGGPGPVTHASHTEQLALAARAIDGLPPRDREIVRLVAREMTIREISDRIGISPSATQKARLRAMERFRKIYTILERAQKR